ncbi:MAG: 50S ribosomal protein L23 [Methylococcaceae bacterium]|nr:50S ribosomal protein L23 [Methylococcaceae bacterium]MCI0668140.1 50S ribosomal protein L23 [Methylococcaceae bacterium]MCI0733151.1 50S ribosomal protein L23 [Methylococcaceae bacterium]
MNQQYLSTVIQSPVVSEKSTVAADSMKRFVFRVQKSATKPEIKRAVEMMFSVEVDAVQVANIKGKTKRFGRTTGKRSDWKKAYVRLKPGHDIDFTGT